MPPDVDAFGERDRQRYEADVMRLARLIELAERRHRRNPRASSQCFK